MKDTVLAAAIIIAAIAATLIHHKLENKPQATLLIQDVFYEKSGLEINVPEDSLVEIHDGYVLIVRPDGLVTMVPNHRLHAIDGREF